jgi:hypothetical protein
MRSPPTGLSLTFKFHARVVLEDDGTLSREGARQLVKQERVKCLRTANAVVEKVLSLLIRLSRIDLPLEIEAQK